MGCIVAAMNSAWLAGGSEGLGRYPTAKVEMYTAPEHDEQDDSVDLQTTVERAQLTDTDRSEMTAEKGFPQSLHVGYEFVQADHDR